MPIYSFKCKKHGEFDVWQKINDEHIAKCSYCGKKADRVFYPLPLHGDLPSKPCNIGKTRNELFDNLAGDGFAAKDWRQSDEYTTKESRDNGFIEKPMVGWTPALGT
jgi:putative FmdB family regulatory protein